MLLPHKAELGWGGKIDIELIDPPDWCNLEEITWTLAQGEGIVEPTDLHKISFVAPSQRQDSPASATVQAYCQGTAVGECVLTFQTWAERFGKDGQPVPPPPEPPPPEPPPTQEDIIKPIDCCRDPEDQTAELKIAPAFLFLGPDKLADIRIPKIHQHCEEHCYIWEIIEGAGMLLCNCGVRCIYRAPKINSECEKNATVALLCADEWIAEAYIVTNTHAGGKAAYQYMDTVPVFNYPFEGTFDYLDLWGLPPPEARGTFLEVNWYWDQYDCEDVLIQKVRRWRYTFMWQKPRGTWKLYNTSSGSKPGEAERARDLDFSFLKTYLEQYQDLRTVAMRKGGCCPSWLAWRGKR